MVTKRILTIHWIENSKSWLGNTCPAPWFFYHPIIRLALFTSITNSITKSTIFNPRVINQFKCTHLKILQNFLACTSFAWSHNFGAHWRKSMSDEDIKFELQNNSYNLKSYYQLSTGDRITALHLSPAVPIYLLESTLDKHRVVPCQDWPKGHIFCRQWLLLSHWSLLWVWIGPVRLQ